MLEGKLKSPSPGAGIGSADMSQMTFSFPGRFSDEENEVCGQEADIASGN